MPKKKATSLPDKLPSYETFLGSVKLISIALDDVSAKVDRDKYWAGRTNKEGDLEREIGTRYTSTDVGKGSFDITAKFELTIKRKENNELIVSVECSYSAHFHASSGCNSQSAERFAGSEAKIIIWPYFRQIVSDITGRMHIPPITIPLALD